MGKGGFLQGKRGRQLWICLLWGSFSIQAMLAPASGLCFLSWQVPFLASFLQNFWQERHLQKRLENRDGKTQASSIPILVLSLAADAAAPPSMDPHPFCSPTLLQILITLSLPARLLLQSLPRFSILSVSLSLSLRGLERSLSSYWILM